LHTFLLGYNVESCDKTRPGALGAFLRAASALHRDMRVPCTFFVRGRSLETHADAFRRAQDESGALIDFQQYTYSGLPLKTICQENHEGIKVIRGLNAEQCRESLSRTSELMQSALGVRPVGLGGPLGYYRGLADRLDILEVMEELGLRFVRSYTRNAHDWSPLAFEAQPFVYDEQGFSRILEIPGQGWPDNLLRETLGYANRERYVNHVKKDLDYVAAKGLVWSYVQYDWSAVIEDPDMTATRAILEYARELGFETMTHRAYWEARAGVADEAAAKGAESESPAEEAPFVITDAMSPAEQVRGRSLRRKRGWRTRRMLMRAMMVRKGRKAALRRLLRKAGSVSRTRLLAAASRR